MVKGFRKITKIGNGGSSNPQRRIATVRVVFFFLLLCKQAEIKESVERHNCSMFFDAYLLFG